VLFVFNSREFNHRVKGLTMSTFNEEEVEALENGGNDVAARIYRGKYREGEFPKPSPGDTQKIRDFIRLTYEEKRWFSKKAMRKKKKGRDKVDREESERKGHRRKGSAGSKG